MAGLHDVNLMPLVWGCVVIAAITLMVPYIYTGRHLVRRWGWLALLPVQRLAIAQATTVPAGSVESAAQAAVREINRLQPRLVLPCPQAIVSTIDRNLYKIELDGSAYWLKARYDTDGTLSLRVRQGLPRGVRYPRSLLIYVTRLLAVPLLDLSGRACLIAREISAELSAPQSSAGESVPRRN